LTSFFVGYVVSRLTVRAKSRTVYLALGVAFVITTLSIAFRLDWAQLV
jgi:hypothetical protein